MLFFFLLSVLRAHNRAPQFYDFRLQIECRRKRDRKRENEIYEVIIVSMRGIRVCLEWIRLFVSANGFGIPDSFFFVLPRFFCSMSRLWHDDIVFTKRVFSSSNQRTYFEEKNAI